MPRRIVACFALVLLFVPASSWSAEIYRDGDASLDVSFWAQAWYQGVEDGRDSDGDGVEDEDLGDFMVRRAYLGIRGEITPRLGFFAHLAADRVGQDGLDAPGSGLGSGIAVRDAWITARLRGDDLMVQLGRMYVPFTRNYGTTATKSLLTTDLDWTQGGVRGSIFYPSKVGRDDGLTVWGNVLEDRLQYRFMVGEGAEGAAATPGDDLRFAGRVSVSLLDPETGWFNQGTYLGKKNVLSFGLGFDAQDGLLLGGVERDYGAFTADVFYEGRGWTVEAAWIDIGDGPNPVNFTRMAAGDDMSIVSAKAGLRLPQEFLRGPLQPFVHYERIGVDGEDDTDVYGLGVNHYVQGPANKLSLDLTWVDQERETRTPGTPSVLDHLVVTFQMAAGF